MKFDTPLRRTILKSLVIIPMIQPKTEKKIKEGFGSIYSIYPTVGYIGMEEQHWYPGYFPNLMRSVCYSIDFIRNFKSEMKRFGLFNIFSFCDNGTDNLILKTMCFRE